MKNLLLACILVVLSAIFGLMLVNEKPDDTAARPWHSYATSKENKVPEWWLTDYESFEDCISDMRYQITKVQSVWYQLPVGCVFSSNSYWKVRWQLFLHPDNNILCISKDTGPDAVKFKLSFSGAIGNLRKGEIWVCVN